MKNWLFETELVGENVRLIPLRTTQAKDMERAASDGELWNLKVTSVPSTSTIDSYIKSALDEQTNGIGLPFVILDRNTNMIIGSTRYCNATPEHRRLEIGYTWYAKSYQRTGVNTECKLLLLQHAFEELDCIAVEFRTHIQNSASKNAILRLGAKQDGILRNHRISPDGSLRDSAVYSITREEWKGVKNSLEFKLHSYKEKT